MIRLLVKEVCGCCNKIIGLGQAITECENCSSVIHSKCFKNSHYQVINTKYYCKNCECRIDRLYNPFENLCRSQSDHSDTHYNAELGDCFEDISAISNLLNNCSRFKAVNDFNNSLKLTDFKNESFSVLFQNIDGNKTNFDNFSVHMKRLEHKFSVIGLAETYY